MKTNYDEFDLYRWLNENVLSIDIDTELCAPILTLSFGGPNLYVYLDGTIISIWGTGYFEGKIFDKDILTLLETIKSTLSENGTLSRLYEEMCI